MRESCRVVFLFCSVTMGACSASAVLGRGPTNTPEELYRRATEDLDDGLYPEALAAFADIKTKFPYSKYAALADLRTADTHFQRGKYLEAIDAYRQFLKLHPNHVEADYAMFRIGEAYFEQIPHEWFFMPPASEKDQTNTRLAISAYRDMLARYPKSKYSDQARAHLDAARTKLAEHELYVARFYWDREKYQGAAGRAEGLLEHYSGLGLDAEALLLDARARAKLGDTQAARQALSRLLKDFPDSSEAGAGAALLRSLGAQRG